MAAGSIGVVATASLVAPGDAVAAGSLKPTSIMTADYSASVNDFVPVDASGGSVTITLPNAPADGSQVGVRTVAFGAGNSVTVKCGSGSDVLNDAALNPKRQSMELSAVDSAIFLQYEQSTQTWYGLAGGPSFGGRAPAVGLSSRTLVEAGRLVVIHEALNALDAGFLVQNSTKDQSNGMQSFLDAIGNALGGTGGRGIVPSGTYHMGQTPLTYPQQPCVIEGDTPIGFYAWNPSGGTQLVWDDDVSSAPHTTYGLTLGVSGRPQALRNVALVGVPRFPIGSGILPCALAGINCGESCRLDGISLNFFSSAVGFGGNNHPFDHTVGDYILAENCGYGFNFLPASSGAGDFHLTRVRLEGSLAAVAVAQSAASGVGGSTWMGCGLYGPFGFYRYGDGSGVQGDFIDSTGFYSVSTELAGHAAAYDELWQSGTQGASIINSIFTWGAGYRAPDPTRAVWSQDFTITTVSGSQITVRDGRGFVFRPGMTVTGSGFAPGTTITSVAGDWPWPSGATLTLSASPSGAPATCTISQPFLATLVANLVRNNEFFGAWDLSAYPMICAGGASLNRHHDGLGAYGAATSHALLTHCVGGATGNTFGLLDSGLCVGSSYACDDFAQGDLVMKRAGCNGVVRCDGSRKPLGAAIRAVSNGTGCIDYLIRGTFEELGSAIAVNNRRGSSIPADSLLKVDTANPGGVVAATNLADGPAIGINGDSAIPGGSVGQARELWL